MRNKFTVGMLIALVVSVFSVGLVLAQNDEPTDGGSGFRITPTRFDLSIDRGSSDTSAINIQNITSVTQTARVVVDDFGPSGDESGTPKILIGDDAVENYPYSIKPFVQPIADITLAPGQSVDVIVDMQVPESTSPGSYYGIIRFISADNSDFNNAEQGAVALSASVGTVFLVQVPGDTVQLLSLEEIGATKDANGSIGRFFASAPGFVAVRLENEGNTFEAPFGKVLVKDWSGKTVYEYEFNGKDPRGNVLPDSIRRFEDPIENIGSIGRYTIEANISYGDGGSIIEARSTFWVIPWVPILIGTLVIVGLAFLGTRGVKAYNARVVRKSKKY